MGSFVAVFRFRGVGHNKKGATNLFVADDSEKGMRDGENVNVSRYGTVHSISLSYGNTIYLYGQLC